MRIMEIVSGARISGAMGHCALLSRELARRGHEVTLLCLPGSWIAEYLANDPVDVIFSDMRRFPPHELHRVSAEIRRRRIEVVHTHISRAHFFGILLRWFAGVPCVATAHTQHFQLHWMFNDLVIAVSESTRRYHRRYNLVRSDRIVTIHNFVPPNSIASEPAASRSQTRASLGVSDGEFLLGLVGTVIPIKGHIYLIRALPKILAVHNGVRLAIVGEHRAPEYAEMLREEAKRLGVADKIIWAGHRADVHSVMSSLDICVVPSLKENLPLVVLEAMAAGIPVVATLVGGIPECLVSGETGLLVQPGDSESLAQALIGLIRDPDRRRALGSAGCCRVRDNFSADKQVALIEAALKRVARPADR
jgi:L-malate glycosyltransferase